MIQARPDESTTALPPTPKDDKKNLARSFYYDFVCQPGLLEQSNIVCPAQNVRFENEYIFNFIFEKSLP